MSIITANTYSVLKSNYSTKQQKTGEQIMPLVFLALLFFGAAVYDKVYAYKANRDYEKYREDMKRKGFKIWIL